MQTIYFEKKIGVESAGDKKLGTKNPADEISCNQLQHIINTCRMATIPSGLNITILCICCMYSEVGTCLILLILPIGHEFKY